MSNDFRLEDEYNKLNNFRLEDECNRLFLENRELTKKYIALLEENKKCNEISKMDFKAMIDAQEDLDTYCDFNVLIKTLKRQDNKIDELKNLLSDILKYFNKMKKVGVSEDEEISLKSRMKKLLESK